MSHFSLAFDRWVVAIVTILSHAVLHLCSADRDKSYSLKGRSWAWWSSRLICPSASSRRSFAGLKEPHSDLA